MNKKKNRVSKKVYTMVKIMNRKRISKRMNNKKNKRRGIKMKNNKKKRNKKFQEN